MPAVGSSPEGNYVQYTDSINVGGDRNWRNNNPGNIEAGDFADAHGAIGSDGRFAIFPDPDTGMRALQSLLTSDSYQGLTIEEAMERYAPPSENDTVGYTAFIVDNVGIDASTAMSDLTAQQLASFADAIETFEGGAAGTTYQVGDAGAPSWVQDIFDGSEPENPDPTPDPGPNVPADPLPDVPSDPVPSPLPGPIPEPLPGPSPAPTPDPPDPTPDPTPEPSPDPTPNPGPDPGPDSGGGDAPADPGGAGDAGGGESGGGGDGGRGEGGGGGDGGCGGGGGGGED